MASCLVCHRLVRGFASPKGQYCSMDCMNATVEGYEAYMPYEELEEKTKSLITKPLADYTMLEAKNLTCDILESWINLCRERVNLPPIKFIPWHDENRFVEIAMKRANPSNFARSIVDMFVGECRDDFPF